jgi:hypothetical protein
MVLEPKLPLLVNNDLEKANLFVRRPVRQLWDAVLEERNRLKQKNHPGCWSGPAHSSNGKAAPRS